MTTKNYWKLRFRNKFPKKKKWSLFLILFLLFTGFFWIETSKLVNLPNLSLLRQEDKSKEGELKFWEQTTALHESAHLLHYLYLDKIGKLTVKKILYAKVHNGVNENTIQPEKRAGKVVSEPLSENQLNLSEEEQWEEEIWILKGHMIGILSEKLFTNNYSWKQSDTNKIRNSLISLKLKFFDNPASEKYDPKQVSYQNNFESSTFFRKMMREVEAFLRKHKAILFRLTEVIWNVKKISWEESKTIFNNKESLPEKFAKIVKINQEKDYLFQNLNYFPKTERIWKKVFANFLAEKNTQITEIKTETIPHLFAFVEAEKTRLAKWKKEGQRISYYLFEEKWKNKTKTNEVQIASEQLENFNGAKLDQLIAKIYQKDIEARRNPYAIVRKKEIWKMKVSEQAKIWLFLEEFNFFFGLPSKKQILENFQIDQLFNTVKEYWETKLAQLETSPYDSFIEKVVKKAPNAEQAWDELIELVQLVPEKAETEEINHQENKLATHWIIMAITIGITVLVFLLLTFLIIRKKQKGTNQISQKKRN